MKKTVLFAVWLAASGAFADDQSEQVIVELSADQNQKFFEFVVQQYRDRGITEVSVDDFEPEVAEELGLKPGSTIPVSDLLKPEIHSVVLKYAPVVDEPIDSLLESESITFPPGWLSSPAIDEAIRQKLGPNVHIIEDPDILQALAAHPRDKDAIRAAVEKALPNLPPEQRRALAHGFQFASDEPNHPESSKRERLPTEEVLALLDSSDRTVLKPYRELLDDEFKLVKAMKSMTEKERIATNKFLSSMFGQTRPSQLPPEILERWQTQGYADMPGSPRGSTLLATIQQAGEDVYGLVYGSSESAETNHLPHVTDDYVMPESENHVVTEAGHAMRIYSRSAFAGALLMVEQQRVAGFYPDVPNLRIAGHPGTARWIRYDDGKWVTLVAGFDGQRVYRVGVETKLEGSEFEEFVNFATTIIEASASPP